MLDRCHNPKSKKYHRYGGRGIFVCDEWRRSFLMFYNYIGPRPGPGMSVERIDNDKGYEPGNVKWASRVEQALNRSTNRFVTAFGQTKQLSEWRKEYPDIPRSTLERRLNDGWDGERALSTSVNRKIGWRPSDAQDFPQRITYRGPDGIEMTAMLGADWKLRYVEPVLSNKKMEAQIGS